MFLIMIITKLKLNDNQKKFLYVMCLKLIISNLAENGWPHGDSHKFSSSDTIKIVFRYIKENDVRFKYTNN